MTRATRGGIEQVLTKRRVVLCVVAAVTLSVTGACSGDEPTESTVAVDVRKNRDRWVLPLDEFFGLNYTISDYAEALLIEECMNGRGFAYPMGEPQRMDQPPLPTENDVYRSLFDAEIAAEFGYGGPPVEPRLASLTPQERAALETPEGQQAFDECVDEAREVLPLPPDRSLVESLTSAAYNSAVASEEVRDAAARWRECMASAGISDLPTNPETMPTDSLLAEWGAGSGGDDVAYRPPSSDEIKTAVQDANCQESSGFAEALYDAEWDIQVGMLAENEDALMRLKAANDEHAKLVEEILNTHG